MFHAYHSGGASVVYESVNATGHAPTAESSPGGDFGILAKDTRDDTLDTAERAVSEPELPSDEYFRSRFGVTREEAMIPVKHGNYSGCLGQMLMDEDCPEGKAVEETHKEGGREAVLERFTVYQSVLGVEFGEDGKFKVSSLPKELPPVKADESKKKRP